MGRIRKKVVTCCMVAVLMLTSLIQVRAAEISNLPVSQQCALVATAFALDKNSDVNSVQLQWATSNTVNRYELYRAQSNTSSQFVKVYEGTGTSYQDIDLPFGDWYYMLVMDGSSQSQVTKVTTYKMPSNLSTYDNVSGSGLKSNNEIYYNGVYYSYHYTSDSAGMNRIDEYTSKDGVNYSFQKTVLDKYSNSELNSCKLEALNFKYSKEQDKVILWANWEMKSGYASGKALVATATPGEKFTVHRVFNPCGIEVRDMNLFLDDNQKGYLVAASNKPGEGANRTLYIFELNSDYTNVNKVVQTLFDNKYREAPSLIKQDGYYYLFTSEAAGWYPSSGLYSSASSIEGSWSGLRDIGNLSTFSCQSGGISSIGSGDNTKYIMMANRWIKGDGTTSQVALPIAMSNGYAFYDYWAELLYNQSTGELMPCQDGQLLSQGKPTTASLSSVSGYDASKVVDGNYNTAFKASKSSWPFWLQIDLGEVCNLSNMQISWYMCKGSEGYYKYQVQTSNDGSNWKTIHYNTDTLDSKVSKTYGFNVNDLSGSGRYVRLYVENAVLQNNTNNWYTPMLYEVKVYGYSQSGAYNQLKNYCEQCNTITANAYTEDSYNSFKTVLNQAKEFISNQYASQNEYKQMYIALQNAVTKLQFNQDAIIEVTETLETAVTYVNQLPSLPQTLEVKTYGGETKRAEVTWQGIWTNQFSKAYDTVKVEGVINNTSIKVSTNIEVVPQNLIYFIDCNNMSSSAYKSIKAAIPSILNDQADQRYSGTWGVRANSMTLYGKSTSETDKKLTGYYGDNSSNGQIEYVLPIKEAGTYRIYLAAHEWWNGPRTMNWDAVYTDQSGREITTRLATDMKVSSSDRDKSFDVKIAINNPTTLKLRGYLSNGTEAAVVSFIGISNTKSTNPVDPPTSDKIVIDSFDNVNSSAYVRNANGNSISVTGENGKGRIDYTVGNPDYTGITKSLSNMNWSEGKKITFELTSDVSGRDIVFQVRDRNGNYFECKKSVDAGSNSVEINLNELKAPSWAGNASSDFSAVSEYSLYIEKGYAGAGKGTMYIDNLVLMK